MTQEHNNDVKILFRFFSEILNEQAVETLWAQVIDAKEGLYKLDNIPFYASVSCDDIVYAEFDQKEQALTYRNTIEHSLNSTIQVIVLDKNTTADSLCETFNILDCATEKFSDGYFVMQVHASTDYTPIRQKLIELEQNKTITYAEPNLSKNHWYEV